MKPNLLKLSFLSLLLFAAFSVHAQYVNNENRGALQQDTVLLPPIEITSPDPEQNLQDYNAQYYKWEFPVFEIVDLNRLQQYEFDNQMCLKELEMLESIHQRNKQQLKSYQEQVKELTKALKIEQRNLNEKRKFYREDERLLKRERKLRLQEEKMIQKERKELRKQTKLLTPFQIEDRSTKLNEREQRVQLSANRWNIKRDALQQNMAKVAETQSILDGKSLELKMRSSELAAHERDQKMLQKQLSLEKKKVKQEIKKAQAAIKAQQRKK